MRVLIIKTSSMGDVIHTLPALTDAGIAMPGITFDWVVEENFAEIPQWHPLVKKIIPVAWRRWRKQLFSAKTRAEWREFTQSLRASHYDLIIDAQGLLKSAVLARFAEGVRCGLNWQSAREPMASWFYQCAYTVDRQQHAVTRVRELFAKVLGYSTPTSIPDYGVVRKNFIAEMSQASQPYLVFLHGTTWATKHWPENYWKKLGDLANQAGFSIKFPWGNAEEFARATRIAAQCQQAEVLPKLDLLGAARVIAGAKAVVAVDTGLGHLAAALDVTTISLYGPTDPARTGTVGQSQQHVAVKFPCAPCFSKTCAYRGENLPVSPLTPQCFATLLPEEVWKKLMALILIPLANDHLEKHPHN